jgi:hypothetical protein
MSPRHQTCLDPLNQFLQTESLERDRARRPDHADVCQSGRPTHTERAAVFACTPTSPGRALHARLHGTQRPSRYRPCPALRCTTASPPSTESLARSLKPVHYRETRPATDTTYLFLGLSSPCRPAQPPTAPNGDHHRCTIDRRGLSV